MTEGEELDGIRVEPGEDLPVPIAPRLRQIADALQAHTSLWLPEIQQLRALADELESRAGSPEPRQKRPAAGWDQRRTVGHQG